MDEKGQPHDLDGLSPDQIAPDERDPRIQRALGELREIILRHNPAATFRVRLGEDPVGIYLIPTVDVEDLDHVADVFIDRLVDMPVEEGLPVDVFPDWPLERIREQQRRAAPRPMPASLPLRAS